MLIITPITAIKKLEAATMVPVKSNQIPNLQISKTITNTHLKSNFQETKDNLNIMKNNNNIKTNENALILYRMI